MWERNESKWDGEENEKPFNGTIIKSVNGGDGEGGKYNEQRILQVMHDCIMTASLSQNMLYINIRLQRKMNVPDPTMAKDDPGVWHDGNMLWQATYHWIQSDICYTIWRIAKL